MKRCEALWTISWFAMDALWMNDMLSASHVLAILGVIPAIVLSFKLTDPKELTAHYATSSWYLMNCCWMASDWTEEWKSVAVMFMWLGISLILLMAVAERDAFAYFRRFRK